MSFDVDPCGGSDGSSSTPPAGPLPSRQWTSDAQVIASPGQVDPWLQVPARFLTEWGYDDCESGAQYIKPPWGWCTQLERGNAFRLKAPQPRALGEDPNGDGIGGPGHGETVRRKGAANHPSG